MRWKRTFCRFEWKPQDLWMGVFWKVRRLVDEPDATAEVLDIWVCLLPMVPFHMQFMRGRVTF